MGFQERLLFNIFLRKGISRSVSIVAGFLMFERGASLVEALTLVRKRRKVADPNVWFVEDLKAYQTRLEADRFNRFRARPLPAAIRPDADADIDAVAVFGATEDGARPDAQGGVEAERAREALRRELQSAREALADAGAAARQKLELQQQQQQHEEDEEEPVRRAAAQAPVAPVYMHL